MRKTEILTSAQAAEKLGVTPDYIRRLIMDGKIKAVKFGNSWTMTAKDISHIKRKRLNKELANGSERVDK